MTPNCVQIEIEQAASALEADRSRVFEETAARALQMLQSDGVSETAILTCLVTGAEAGAGSKAVSSILVLDKKGLLRNRASPNLPRDYLDAIDRIKPDANVGTCAAAAATGSVVVTPDFCADGKWAELRHLPMELGFVGAWSTPIFSSDGRVLGTFGTYFREGRQPSREEFDGVQRLAEIAAMTLERESI
jgi:GAF domain-containing protein